MRPATVAAIIIIISFAILGPILIFWTAGFRWNERTERFELTGILVFDSLPRNASIMLGEEVIERKTPARLTGLLPRDYTVTVSREGYQPWRQTVAVEGGKTTFAQNIRLFPEQTPELVFEKSVERLALSPDGTLLAADVERNGFVEIWTIDTQDNSAARAGRFTDSGIRSLAWSPTGGSLLVVPEEEGVKPLLLHEGTSIPLDIGSGTLLEIGWSQDDPARLVATTRESDRSFRTRVISQTGGPSSLLHQTKDSEEHALIRNNVLFLTKSTATTTAVHVLKPPETETKPLFDIPGGPYDFLHAPPPYLAFADSSRGRFLVTNEEGRLIHDVNAREAAWTKRGSPALIAWDEFELNLLVPFFSQVTLARVSEGIEKAAWLAEETHVLLLTPRSLTAIAREAQLGARATTVLGEFSEAKDLSITDNAAWVAGTIGEKTGIFKIRLR